MTAVVRDCNSSIPLQAAQHVRITDRCVHGTFKYLYQGFSLQVDATICPCFTSLCNTGSITLGNTGSPVTTTRRPTTTRCYKCNSIETPSCQLAGKTNDWSTCQDNMCLTGIGRTQLLGNSINTASTRNTFCGTRVSVSLSLYKFSEKLLHAQNEILRMNRLPSYGKKTIFNVVAIPHLEF